MHMSAAAQMLMYTVICLGRAVCLSRRALPRVVATTGQVQIVIHTIATMHAHFATSIGGRRLCQHHEELQGR